MRIIVILNLVLIVDISLYENIPGGNQGNPLHDS